MVRIPVVVGATGIGKSSLAITLAEAFGGEIISCDSRQIYRGMDIGTAKGTPQELERIPHHLINIIDPEEEYSAGRWAVDAENAIQSCISRGKLPIICGGTFFYLTALRNGFDSTTEPDQQFRNEALLREEIQGDGTLYRELQESNPQRASELHPNDVYRIIRALQIVRDGKGETEGVSDFSFELIELVAERSELYKRINTRVDKMIENGLFEEFKTLLDSGYNVDTPGLKCVGYREFFNYIENNSTFDVAVEKIKQNSRKYAKRQLTWLRNRENPCFQIDINDVEEKIPSLIEAFKFEEIL